MALACSVDSSRRGGFDYHAGELGHCRAAQRLLHERESGPKGAMMNWSPPSEAPMQAYRLAISSSILMNVPPTVGSSNERNSATSDYGVIGCSA